MPDVMLEVSARHCHLSQEHVAKLFGEGHELHPLRNLSQPGQFAAEETILLSTEKGEIERLRVLGPARSTTQVELSVTDARNLRLKAPIRNSGDLTGSAGCMLRGPSGEVELDEGVIIANRHIHVDPQSAEKLGLSDGQVVSVRTRGQRSTLFGNVLVRVNEAYALAMHIDTDEGNAALDGSSAVGEIIV